MRLDQELVVRNLCESRTEAQEIIARGSVRVNGAVITKQTKQVKENDAVEVSDRRKYVSRGGEKLEGALLHVVEQCSLFNDQFSSKNQEERIREFIQGKQVLDVGSSTGGFTDYLLRNGVKKVVAIDVGTEQMHSSLRSDPRVELHEQTDIRDFHTDERFDLVVGDVSFIPLAHVVPALVRLSHAGTQVLFLIKPQFEVGKGNTKKGIVRDETLYEGVLEGVKKNFQTAGFLVSGIVPSPIVGGDGNKEFFIYAKKE